MVVYNGLRLTDLPHTVTIRYKDGSKRVVFIESDTVLIVNVLGLITIGWRAGPTREHIRVSRVIRSDCVAEVEFEYPPEEDVPDEAWSSNPMWLEAPAAKNGDDEGGDPEPPKPVTH